MVLFFIFIQNNCKSCEEIIEMMILFKKDHRFDGVQFKIINVDGGGGDHVDRIYNDLLRIEYDVYELPTFIMVDADRNEIKRIIGKPSLADLKSLLGNLYRVPDMPESPKNCPDIYNACLMLITPTNSFIPERIKSYLRGLRLPPLTACLQEKNRMDALMPKIPPRNPADKWKEQKSNRNALGSPILPC
ncbi:MAG: hypothetical protein Q7S28_01990 [bacterium]|nr:hypothetical protein [bacterium]